MPVCASKLRERVVDDVDVAAPDVFAVLQDQLDASFAAALAPALEAERVFQDMLGKQLQQIFEQMNSFRIPVPEVPRLDELFGMSARLASPAVEQAAASMLESRQLASRQRPPSKPLARRTIQRWQRQLADQVMERVGQVTSVESEFINAVAFLAVLTGSWMAGILLMLDILRQRAMVAQRSSERIAEEGRHWTVDVEWDPADEAWIAFVPELNNISTYGASRDEALRRAREAIRGYLKAAARRGLPIPELSDSEATARRARQLRTRAASA